jgi:hypothetical protein
MTPRALRGMAVNEIGRARISMMVRSMSSNSRPDTLVQDRTPQPHRFLLQRTAGPYMAGAAAMPPTNAPFAELVKLSPRSIADEMREEYRKRVLGV